MRPSQTVPPEGPRAAPNQPPGRRSEATAVATASGIRPWNQGEMKASRSRDYGFALPRCSQVQFRYLVHGLESEFILSDLLLVPLEDTVVFPGMTVTLAVDAGDDDRVLLVPTHEQEYAKVGTVAEVADRVRLPGGATAVALTGLHRAVIGAAHTDSQ